MAVGFGVRTAEQAAAIARDADGVVVGSALVNALKDTLDDSSRATARTLTSVTDLVGEFARGVRSLWRNKDGAALVETIVVVPVVFTLTFGVYEFAWVFYTHQLVSAGIRDAARYAAPRPSKKWRR